MRKDKTLLNVLGYTWCIRWATDAEEPRFENGKYAGITDENTREIIMRDYTADEPDGKAPFRRTRADLRHEIIHAFLWESGLWANSNESDAWAQNEEMVDWFAIQHEKLHDAFAAADALEPRPQMTLEEYKKWCIMQSLCTPSKQYVRDMLQAQECPCCTQNDRCGQEQPPKSEDDEKTRKKIESLKESIEKMEIRDKFFHQISDAVKGLIFPKETGEGNAE